MISRWQDFAVSYIAEIHPYVKQSFLLFVLGIVCGLYIWFFVPEGVVMISDVTQEFLQSFSDISLFSLLFFIFLNNALKVLLAIVLGIAFGLTPVFFLVSNGIIIPIVIGLSLQTHSFITILAGILPHGILEIPLALVGAAVGLSLGHKTWMRIQGDTGISIVQELKRALLFYGLVLMPLLFVAACIETFITPFFMILTQWLL